jgi:uncharacterized protein YneF (UPF0154 family)
MWASVPTLAVVGLAAILGTEVVCKYFKKQLNKNIKNVKQIIKDAKDDV